MQKLVFSTRFISTILQVLLERGWENAGEGNNYDFAWLNKEEITPTYEYLRTSGKKFFVNHFSSHQMLSRKDKLAQNVQGCYRKLEKAHIPKWESFVTIPLTFVLPESYSQFLRYAGSIPKPDSDQRQRRPYSKKQNYEAESIELPRNLSNARTSSKIPIVDDDPRPVNLSERTGDKFIVKPACLLQGMGIFIATLPEIQIWWQNDYRRIQEETVDEDQKIQANILAQYQKKGIQISKEQVEANYKSGHDLYLIQKYIENPLLINQHKFDCRIYVLVRSFKPLNVYICREGFARFSLKSYFTNDLASHLTNVAIQKKAADYDNSEQGDGAKWGLFKLFQHIRMMYGSRRCKQCQRNVEITILRTLQSVADLMNQQKNSFEIYGFDVMLTDELEVKICEVNACPSLSADTAEDEIVKKRMLHDAMSIVVDGFSQKIVGCFHQLFNGIVNLENCDEGMIDSGILIGDATDRVIYFE